MLELVGLTKRYGERMAVDALTLTIPRGGRFGLLGPNGAGKTTTISMIVGSLLPDAGQILWCGEPLTGETNPLKRKIGYVPQELALYEELSAVDNLRFFGALYGLKHTALEKRVQGGLEAVGLAERATSRVRTFSGGMKRRLNIAAALLHGPELLILDEPTVGVDPQSRNAIFENLEALSAAGITLLYTTHYMEEVERLCQSVAIMDHGKMLANGTLTELRRTLPALNRVHLELTTTEGLTETETLSRSCGATYAALVQTTLSLDLPDLTQGTACALTWLAERGIGIVGVTTERPGLEAIFLHLTGRSLRDG